MDENLTENLMLGLLAASLLIPAALMIATGAPILSALLGGILLLPVSLPIAAIIGGALISRL